MRVGRHSNANLLRIRPLPALWLTLLMLFCSLSPFGTLQAAARDTATATDAASSAAALPAGFSSRYPGTITVHVDATNLSQKIFRVHQRMPVQAGSLRLLYPQWIPGHHSPSASVTQLAGLQISANGTALAWQRDPLDMFAFQLEIPAGVSSIELDYQYLSPLDSSQGRITATHDIVGVQWIALLLYPDRYLVSGISVQASLRLPQGWQYASALNGTMQADGVLNFPLTSLATLMDSPLFAGKYFQRHELAPGAAVPVGLNTVADQPDALALGAEQLTAHRQLMQQAYKLFGSGHFERYEFLLALSDEFSAIGLEHLQSSENGVRLSYFSDWDNAWGDRDLLPHELVHSWNGKFRRPAGLRVPNYNTPVQNQLLWLYEGQTQYWAEVLAARSGLKSRQQALDSLAGAMADLDAQDGRRWRSLQDTTYNPIMSTGQVAWPGWQRTEDYYTEGQLLWLEVDARLRQLSNEQTSLDDFARRFFAAQPDGRPQPDYRFEDIVAALNTLASYDWAGLLQQRLSEHVAQSPRSGLRLAGWQLVFNDQPNLVSKMQEHEKGLLDLSHSLGITLGKGGRVEKVRWEGLAFKKGLVPGAVLLAVDGRAYQPALLKQAISAATTSRQTIDLIFKKDDRYQLLSFDYHDGLKYPHLQRIEGSPDRLSRIFQALP